jgi:Ca2+-binding RTX toxin-like protein
MSGNLEFSLTTGLFGPGTQSLSYQWTEETSPFYLLKQGTYGPDPFSVSANILDVVSGTATLTAGAEYKLGFGLVGDIDLKFGEAQIQYGLAVHETSGSTGNGAFLDTSGWHQTSAHMQTEGLDLADSSITLALEAIAYASVFAHLAIDYEYGIFDKTQGSYDEDLFRKTFIDFSKTWTILDIHGDAFKKTWDLGYGSITAQLPGGFTTSTSTTTPDSSGLGQLATSGMGDPFLTAELDFAKIVGALFAVPPEVFSGKFSVDVGIVSADIDYTTLAVSLAGNLSLAQSFTFDPSGVEATMVSSLGETLHGELGERFDFTTPDGEGAFTVTATYTPHGTFTNTVGIHLGAEIDWLLAQFDVTASASIFDHDFSVGPYSYDGISGTVPLGDGVTIPIKSFSYDYALSSRTVTYVVQYENFHDGTEGDDNVTLTTNQTTIEGGGGHDRIGGNNQHNTLSGGTGNDSVSGGGGNDTVSGGDGADSLRADEGADSLHGGSGNDSLDGGSGDDSLHGGTGHDSLVGGHGSNLLNGGTGHDTLAGGNSADTLSGGDGNDRLDAGEGDNNADGGTGHDTLSAGGGNDRLAGGDGNDSLSGGEGANTLSGGAGDDRILAGNGADSLMGGDGHDRITAGEGNNTVAAGTGNDTVVAGHGADSLNGGDGNDNLTGNEGNNTLIGGNGNDSITTGGGTDSLVGGAGADTITAGHGNDTLVGGTGADVLNGGGGIDRFVFQSVADAAVATPDRIIGFAAGDRIDLGAIDANASLAGNQAFAWIGTAAFTGAGQLHYAAAGAGQWLVTGNVDANLAPDFAILVGSAAPPTAAWFVL